MIFWAVFWAILAAALAIAVVLAVFHILGAVLAGTANGMLWIIDAFDPRRAELRRQELARARADCIARNAAADQVRAGGVRVVVTDEREMEAVRDPGRPLGFTWRDLH